MIPEIEEMSAEIDDSEDFPLPESTARVHTRQFKSGTDIFIPYNVLQLPDVVAVATRLEMTPADVATITTALILACGGDISKVKNET